MIVADFRLNTLHISLVCNFNNQQYPPNDPKKNISYKDMQYLIITQGNVI